MAKKNTKKKIITNVSSIIVICIILGLAALICYFKLSAPSSISFNETSNTDYKVYLKDNDFYKKEYVDKDNQYISSLIENIDAIFKYNMNICSGCTYNYTYKIVAKVEVNELANNNTIYEFKESIYKSEKLSGKGKLNIEQKINIDFPKYNDLINKFRETYELSESKSDLNVVLYLSLSNLKNTKEVLVDKEISSLNIPLTKNTISIEKTNNKDNISINVKGNEVNFLLLFAAVLFLLIAMIYITCLIIYIKRTRTAGMIYKKEIKSIMSNYDSYIQKITGSYDIGTSQVLKIESFNDMLEIRDTLRQPILMLENEKKDGTFFIIPATNNIIYTYGLRVVDIEAKMKGKEIPTYDITEIPHTEFKKNKKYTKEYIDEEITRTSLMPAVDDKNIIKGNKDKETDLYEQLELTRSFSIDEIKKAVKDAKKKKDKKIKSQERKVTRGRKKH